jgi:hypothetical protein
MSEFIHRAGDTLTETMVERVARALEEAWPDAISTVDAHVTSNRLARADDVID